MVTGIHVIADPDQGGLAAFNATTGKLLWRNLKVSGGATGANGVIYVADSSSLVMLNSSSGGQLGMRQPPSGFQFNGGAVPLDGHIYIAASSPTADRLIASSPDFSRASALHMSVVYTQTCVTQITVIPVGPKRPRAPKPNDRYAVSSSTRSHPRRSTGSDSAHLPPARRMACDAWSIRLISSAGTGREK